ncbi:microcystin degradation protein MlrC [Ochrobactrum daejeonense]|uniref:Microcystinase C n=1 Tax=Brucella daejeonensis TaxID=659015 RepID=A0A7W9AZ10_9HYPH|nr:M81 family metallopeptidase [Brucella daejeonensis]MBB5703232.1 microcystin degradation protein MlrC [Brucella daejeonensis]
MPKRVAVAGFLHETNTFAASPADMAAFIQGGGYIPLSRGAAILDNARNVNLGIAGALDFAREAGWEIVPILWAGAIPSAPVTRDAYEAIVSEIVEGLENCGPVDGIFIDLHGAMVAEHIDDGEGELLQRVRAVRPAEPLAVALDLHGNITRRMFEHADVMVGFRTYPHVDMAETGYRSAKALEALMDRPEGWHKAMRQGDYLIPIAWQCTDDEPAKSLYGMTVGLPDNVLTASLFMGFPAADFAECGPSVFAYGWGRDAVETCADTIMAALKTAEPSFAGTAYQPEEGVAKAIALARDASRPVIIADTQDNPGAGGSSDTTGMLRALVACGAERAAIGCIHDPEAANIAHQAGEGAEIEIALGGKSGIEGDGPFTARFIVEKLSDGRAHATGPYYGGTWLNMGPSACLRLGGTRVVVTSNLAQMADRALYRMVGIEPEKEAILVNKSSVHFRADFAPIAEKLLVCTAPGAMPISPAKLSWKHLRPGIRLEPLGPKFT